MLLRQVIIFTVLWNLYPLVTAAVLLSRQIDGGNYTIRGEVPAEQCGFEGNPDLYGLGIRLGIYFQWLSGQLCRLFYKEYVVELHRAYMVFLVAVFIALLVLTGEAKSTHGVEVVILLYVLISGPFNFISGKNGEFRLIALVTIEFIVVWSSTVYSCWFWFRGIIQSKFLQEPPNCGPYGFLFKRVFLYSHSVISFFRAMSIFLTILFALFQTLWFFIVPVARWKKDRQAGKSVLRSINRWWSPSKMEGRTGGPTPRDDFTKGVLNKLYSAFILAWPILSIELTLKWNSISDVYTIKSIGQLIPFVTGAAGLVQVVYCILRKHCFQDPSESSDNEAAEQLSEEPKQAST